MTAEEILNLLAQHDGIGFVTYDWLVGVHIVNLQRIRHIKEFMQAAVPPLVLCAKQLRQVDRSDKRHDRDVIKEGSRMYEVGGGPRLDRVGAMQQPHNFKKPGTDERSKFELIQEADHVLDGVVVVQTLFCFC